MISVVWEFVVRGDRIADFVKAYSPSGPWTELFHKSAGYHGTFLLRDAENPLRYLVMDRWESLGAQQAMRNRFAREYEALDAYCEQFTQVERCMGIFEEE